MRGRLVTVYIFVLFDVFPTCNYFSLRGLRPPPGKAHLQTLGPPAGRHALLLAAVWLSWRGARGWGALPPCGAQRWGREPGASAGRDALMLPGSSSGLQGRNVPFPRGKLSVAATEVGTC